MSRRTMALLALVVMAAGGWMLWYKDRIHSVGDAWRLAREQLAGWTSDVFSGASGRSEPAVRVASFCLAGGSAAEGGLSPASLPFLAEILAEFDVVALQSLPIGDGRALDELARQLNARGGRYAVVVPPAANPPARDTCAFVYNQETLQMDGAQSVPVSEGDSPWKYPPWVGWFRTRAVDADQAFTFSLVNLQFEPGRGPADLARIGELFRAIRSDGRGEDDVILVGDFQAGESQLALTRQQVGLTWLIRGIPTSVQLDRQTDNVLIDPLAGSEYTGRSGALDFVKRFNLGLDEAQRISTHLPVWAEFALVEGATPVRTADGLPGLQSH